MKILVTGAAGFVGARLIERLIREQYNVGVIIRPTTNVRRIQNLLDKVSVYKGDLADGLFVKESLAEFKPSVILHLATSYVVSHKSEDIGSLVNGNLLPIVNLLESSKENKVDLFVNTSTGFIYKETGETALEKTAVEPLNLYALMKWQAEEMCQFYTKKFNQQCITLRIFAPYGPGDNERRLIPTLTEKLLKGESMDLTSGKQKWDFVYVDDVVEAYLNVIQKRKKLTKNDVFNVGSGVATTVHDAGEMIKKEIGGKGQLHWGTVEHRSTERWFMCAGIEKTHTVLGWKPKVELKSGLQKTVEWIKNSRKTVGV